MFPRDALNVRDDYYGNFSGQTILNVPNDETYTVLYESFNTEYTDQGGHLYIDCGETRLLAVNNFKTVPVIEQWKMAKCTEDIKITEGDTTGANASTTISIVYVPYDIATLPYPPTFQEWLFVGSVLIFFVSLMSWRYIFRPVKEVNDQ
jgi:hypothetical protein